ncbi:MAG: hypothetical protein RIC87_04295 [Kiloniellales bacterium]
MVKSLVLHIGDPKTGTNAVQHVLGNHLYECEDKSLFFLPSRFAHELAEKLMQQNGNSDADISAYLRPFAERYNKSDADIGVISSDKFASSDPARLHALITGHFEVDEKDLKVVSYLRPHCDALTSRYAQQVKTGQFTGTLDQFYALRKASLNYTRRIRKWKNVFGDNHSFHLFSRDALEGGDIVVDFFKNALKLENVTLQESQLANQSPSVKELSVIRQYYLNVLGDHPGKIRKMQDYDKPWTKIDKYFLSKTQDVGEIERVTIHKKLWEKIQPRLAADARRVDKMLKTKDFFGAALERYEAKVVRKAQDLSMSANFSPEEERILQSLLLGIQELKNEADSNAKTQASNSEG